MKQKLLPFFKIASLSTILAIPIIVGISASVLYIFFAWLNSNTQQSSTDLLTVFLAIANLIALAWLWTFLNNMVLKPIQKLKIYAKEVSEGNLEIYPEVNDQHEIGQITESIRQLADNIKKARDFTQSIGKGDYEEARLHAEETLDEKRDILFKSLMLMRDQLKSIAEADHTRNWITNGLAEFTQILRSNDTDLKQLAQKIITNLVRYLQASQGGLFILDSEDAENTFLDLTACYAYDEIQYTQKKIIVKDTFGEGLVGQAFLEQETIYLTKIPENYSNIISGMGNANPRSVLIVPLQLNGRTEGVIEIASFQPFEPYKIEFVERLSENISSAILTIKSNDNTKRLLKESQALTEQVKIREEELRYNMTALQATQEELNEKSKAIIELKEEEARNAHIKAKEIESKNQLITASIQYAQNIQRSILPSEDAIKEVIQDFYVIYLPKDIVSGDFYWFSHIENMSFFAAVDCTGHGVPGAFMSIIGNTTLNEIVNVQHVFEPGKILELLHQGIRTKLRQADSTNNDGMDLVLCRLEKLDEKRIKVVCSGAKRPIFYLENEAKALNAQDIKELPANRKSIGGWQHEDYRTFEQQEIILKKGDYLYLMTDGVVDNPNNRRKKFGTQRFKDIAASAANDTLPKQKFTMLEAIIQHQAQSEQRDDITLLALQL
jgi:serine phosphatase RsbU (regulator of sigma subunit)/HAMP domain-containing protein